MNTIQKVVLGMLVAVGLGFLIKNRKRIKNAYTVGYTLGKELIEKDKQARLAEKEVK